MRLFLFGSLRDPDLLEIVLDQSIDGLRTDPAWLDGHIARYARDESYPILVAKVGHAAAGLLLGGLDNDGLERIRFFEGGEYRLVPVRVRTGDHVAVTAQVFESTGLLRDSGYDWHLAAWQRVDKDFALEAARLHMRHFGTLSIEEVDGTWDDIKREAAEILARRQAG